MKSIPVTLQAHKDAQASAACHLVRITPVVGNNSPPAFGVTSLDVDVVYDDGNGPLTYYASNGADISSIASSLNLDVDNAEITSLLSEFDIGTITEADVASGKLDYAEFIVYLVNPDDLAAGHEIVSSGTLGEARTIDGASVVVEMRGLSQKLKRSIVERDSIRCRAIFGSMAGDPGVRFPCNFDISAEWIAATVSGVGAEPDRQFSLSGVAVPDGFLAPGVVEWLTGANTGRTHEIESQIGATFDLAYHADFDITVGDTARVRRDCAKRYNEDCISKFNNRQNFRGEPLIPLGEEGSKQASASAPAPPANPILEPAPMSPVGNPVVIANLDFESGDTGWSMSPGAPGTFAISNVGGLADTGTWYGRYTGAPGGFAAVNIVTDGVLILPGSPVSVNGRLRIVSTTVGITSVTIRVMITSESPMSEFADVNSIISTFKFSSSIDGTLQWSDLDAVNFAANDAFASPIWLRVGVVIQNPVGVTDVLIDGFSVTATGP